MNKSATYLLLSCFMHLFSMELLISQINPMPLLDEFIIQEMDNEQLPGLSAVIVKEDKIVWMNSYGFADIENMIPAADTSVYLLASISKLFTGTAVMQLAENNLINLDDGINNYLPWTLQIPGFQSDELTYRQLMTHTSSIQDNYAVMENYYDYPDPTISLEDCMARYFSTTGMDYSANDNFLAMAPGTAYEYSNIATALNGYLVELVSEMPFDQYCKENIFEKLCMLKTSWFFRDFDSTHVVRPYQYQAGNYVPYPNYGFADYPSGQLRSNVSDMANFMIAFINEGHFGTDSILSAASINQMLTLQVPDLDAYQGLNWYQEELYHNNGSTLVWGHNGGELGVTTNLYIDIDNKIGICVLANGEGDALSICDEIYTYALSLNTNNAASPSCLITSSIDNSLPSAKDRTLIKIVDVLGRETPVKKNTPLVKLHSDGSAERIFIFE